MHILASLILFAQQMSGANSGTPAAWKIVIGVFLLVILFLYGIYEGIVKPLNTLSEDERQELRNGFLGR